MSSLYMAAQQMQLQQQWMINELTVHGTTAAAASAAAAAAAAAVDDV